MKRKIELIMALLFLLGAIVASRELSKYVSSGKVEKGIQTVVIDAGHGFSDPGKIGVGGVLEKEVNLQIAKKVQKILTDKGIRVVMTREDDLGLYDKSVSNKKAEDMKKRVDLINRIKPEVAVSIHQNSYHEGSVKGAQVFYYAHSEAGKKAALIMQEELRAFDSANKRQAKENTTYYMLKKTEIPTIIVECGFLSNPTETQKLQTEDYQKEVAEAICTGIIKCLAQ